MFPAEYLEQERKALGEHAFKHEYLGIPVSGAASPFTWERARDRFARAIDAARCGFRATAAAAAGAGARSVSRSHLKEQSDEYQLFLDPAFGLVFTRC